MPAPTLVSTTPSNGATGVAKNVALRVVFDTPLLASCVSPKNFVLVNSKVNEVLSAQVSLSTDGLTVTIIPDIQLMPNCGHRLRLIGTDVNSTDPIAAADSSQFALTVSIVFQTGDTLEATAGDKTSGQTDLQGELELPDDVAFKAEGGAPLRLVSTSPSHHSFKISASLSQVAFRFSNDLDAGTVTGNVLVRQYAYYEEESYRARDVDLGNGEGLRHYFMGETGHYNADPTPGLLDPLEFRDRLAYPEASGEFLHIRLEDGYEFPKNMCLEITLGADIADVDGNVLGDDFIWFGCTAPYPDWASIMGVRHECGHDVSGFVPDDFVGLRIWRATIDLMHESDWRFPSTNPNEPMQRYVRTKSAIDVWDDLLAAKGLSAGTSKRLGDLEINVTPAAGGARPTKLRRLEDSLELLERNLWFWLTQSPRVGIKSIADAMEPGRGFFRDRLWRAELMMDRSGSLTSAIEANTALERFQGNGYAPGTLVTATADTTPARGWGLRHHL